MIYDLLQTKRGKILFGLVLGGLILLLFLVSRLAQPQQETTAPEFVPLDAPAILLGDVSPLRSALENSIVRLDSLRSDVTSFAGDTIEPYSNGSRPIKYVIESVDVAGDTITVTGVLENDNTTRLQVDVTLLPNQRIQTKLTADGKSSSTVPSNSQRNQFIATLPLFEEDYSIEFDSSTNSYVITLYDVLKGDEATNYIATSSGVADISEENIKLVPVDSEIGRVRLVD